MRAVRTLLILLCVQLTVSLSGVLYLSRTYYWGLRAVVLHVALVTCLMLATALGLGLTLRFRWLRASPWARRALLLCPATLSYTLTVLYAADAVSNHFWVRNLNYEAVVAHVSQLAATGQGLIPLSGGVYAGLGGTFLVIVCVYQGLAAAIWNGLTALFLPGPSGRLCAAPRGTMVLLAATLLLWTATGGYLARVFRTPQDFLLLRFEPLTSFFLSVTEVHFATNVAAQTALRAQQSSERAHYRVSHAFHKRHVIIIMIDSARADHLQVYGYNRQTTPFLTRLLASGQLRLVKRALSTCSESNCGIMSTLGSQPYRALAVDNFKLYDVLRDQGYRLFFILAGSHSWYGLKSYYAEKPDVLFDGANAMRYPGNDDRVLFEGLDQVPASDGTPAFLYLHLVSAHAGGIRQERFRLYTPCDFDWTTAFFRQPEAGVMINWHDNGVRQADAIVEELFGVLERKGYLHDSLVVLLADHGEGFGEHGTSWHYFGHTRFLYQEHIHIPLMIYDTPAAPYQNLEFATQMDVAPTIVDRLGLPIPASWRGRSLLQPDVARYTFHQSTEHPPIQMVVFYTPDALYKLMRHSSGVEEMYEVISDPMERHNLIDSAAPGLVSRLREELRRYLESY
jgi:hypothetical protein